jgi:hypothetical protein
MNSAMVKQCQGETCGITSNKYQRCLQEVVKQISAGELVAKSGAVDGSPQTTGCPMNWSYAIKCGYHLTNSIPHC